MRECQGRQILIGAREAGKTRDHIDDLAPHQGKRISHDNQIGVIANIAAGRAEVDNSLCLRTLQAIGIDMAHHVMPHKLLPGLGILIIDVILMGLQLIDLLLRNIQSQLFLGLSQRDPQLSPCAELLILGEQVLHLLGCVSL